MSDVTAWPLRRLGDLIEAKYGKALPQPKRRAGAIPVYGSNGIVGWHDEGITRGPVIIIGRKGSSGAINLSPVPCWPIDTTYYIDDPGPYLIDFLDQLLRSLGLTELDRSTAIPGLNREQLYDIEIPVPAHHEQELIVKVLKGVEKLNSGARHHLSAAHRVIERFRQSVFASASAGRLTADWRENNQSLESATQLLDSIRAVRRGAPRPIEPEEVNAPEGEETPPVWTWVRFGSVIGELRNGVSTAPAMEPPGIPILRISAVRRASVDLGDLRFLRDDIHRWMSFTLRDGDLLFTRYNGSISLLGVCGMVRGLEARTILHPDKIMKVRFDHDLILPEYVEIFFASPPARARMTAGSVSSAGQQGISGATVKNQVFALPPLEEQKEIVRRVSKMLEAVDGVERSVEKAAKHLESSSQAILAKAFRGELSATPGDLRQAEQVGVAP